MSQRYECYDADSANIKIVPPGSELDEDDAADHALIVGNPWSAALALLGGLDGIERFAYRVLTEAKTTRARLTATDTAPPAPGTHQRSIGAAPDAVGSAVLTGELLGPAEHWQTGDIVLAADRQLWCRASEHHAAQGWPWAYAHSYAPRQHGESLPEGAVDEQTPARPLTLLLRDGRTPQTAPALAAAPYDPDGEKDLPMKCTHNEFPTLAPTTVDDLADNFDTATLTAMQRDVEALAAGNGPTAAAWRKVTATLTEAHEQRQHLEATRQALRPAPHDPNPGAGTS